MLPAKSSVPAFVAFTPSPHKHFLLMFSFNTKLKSCNKHKTRSSSFIFLMIELSFILSFIKMEDVNTC